MTKILAFGNSHLHSINSAQKHGYAPHNIDLKILQLNSETFDPWATWDGLQLIVNPIVPMAISDAFSEFRPDAILSIMGGNEYIEHSCALDPIPFDFIFPGKETLPLSCNHKIIPYYQVYDYAMSKLDSIYSIVGLSKKFSIDIYCPSLPPPVEDSNFFISNLPQVLREAIEERKSANVTLRLKFWLVYNAALQEICQRNNFIYLPPPEGTVNTSGYINPNYRGDAIHASPHYGSLVLEQLLNSQAAQVEA